MKLLFLSLILFVLSFRSAFPIIKDNQQQLLSPNDPQSQFHSAPPDPVHSITEDSSPTANPTPLPIPPVPSANNPSDNHSSKPSVKDHVNDKFVPSNGVLLVPDIAGTGLFVDLDDPHLKHCKNQTATHQRLWAAISETLPPRSRQLCWIEKIALKWGKRRECMPPPPVELDVTVASAEASSAAAGWVWSDGLPWPFNKDPIDSLVDACEDQYMAIPGVNVTVDSPGLTHGFDYLDYVEGTGVYGTKYFHELIQELKLAGYVEGDTLIGHPFDWRYPLWQLNFRDLKMSIEKFVNTHPGKKVVIIAHSLGAAMTNFFLTRLVDSSWKSQHIEYFVPVAGAFGGSPKAVRSLLSGNADTTTVDFFNIINVSLIPPLLLRRANRSFGSMYSLVPNLHLYGKDTPVIQILNPEPDPNFKPTDPFSDADSIRPGWTFYIRGCPITRDLFYCLFNYQQRHFMSRSFSAPPTALKSGAPLPLSNYTTAMDSNILGSSESASLSITSRRLIVASAAPPASSLSLETSTSFPDVEAENAPETSFGNVESKEDSPAAAAVYTMSDWWKLLPVEHQGKAKQAQEKIASNTAMLDDPGVPVYCIWALLDYPSTEMSYVYKTANLDTPPEMKLVMGDKTLPVESASHCKTWKSTIISREFKNSEHMSVLRDPVFLRFVVSLVSGVPLAATEA